MLIFSSIDMRTVGVIANRCVRIDFSFLLSIFTPRYVNSVIVSNCVSNLTYDLDSRGSGNYGIGSIVKNVDFTTEVSMF